MGGNGLSRPGGNLGFRVFGNPNPPKLGAYPARGVLGEVFQTAHTTHPRTRHESPHVPKSETMPSLVKD